MNLTMIDAAMLKPSKARQVPSGTPARVRILLASLLTASTVAAQAQQAQPTSTQADGGSDGTRIENVVVYGFRRTIEDSLERERAADNLVSVLSADDIGSMPDKNVADALSRLAGVSISTNDGEGRFVTIRGVEPGLNGLTFNGETIATSDSDGRSGRAAPLDILSSASASRIEVVKTVTSDMDGQSLGGTINIVTPSAFDYDSRQRGFGFAEAGVNDMNSSGDQYSGEFSFAFRFGAEEEWGAFLSYHRSQIDYLVEEAEFDGWDPAGPNDYFVPEEMLLNAPAGERKREGATLNLEYRPDVGRQLYFRAYTTSYDNFQDRPQIGLAIDDISEQPTPTTGTADDLFAQHETRVELTERKVDQFVLGGAIPLTPAFTLSGSANYTDASEDNPYLNYILFRPVSRPGASYDISNPDHQQFFAPEETYAADAMTLFWVRPEKSEVNEETTTGRLDLEWDGELFGVNATLKSGVKYVDREKFVDDTSIRYLYVGPPVTFASDEGTGPFGAPYDSFQDGRYTLGQDPDADAIFEWFNQTRPSNPTGDIFAPHENDLWQFLAADSAGNSVEDDYRLNEKIAAWYLMSTFRVNPKLTVIAGARVEHTDSEIAANLLLDGPESGIEPIQGQTDYTNVLPNAQFRYDISERLQLRGALTWTLSRPDYVDMAPISDLEYDDADGDGEFEGELSIGNPGLEPYEAFNIDVSLSYLFSDAGAVTAAFFRKDIDNPIYDFEEDLEDVEFQGRFFEDLERNTVLNADSGEINGLEIGYQQDFTFLPSPFDGLGIVGNYTWIDSTVRTFDRPDEVTFFNQPDRIANVQLYYQDSRLELRLGYRMQGESLDGIGGSPQDDGYDAEFEQVDVKGAFRFNDNWSVYAEVRNLTDEKEIAWVGDPSHRLFEGWFGTTYLAGVGWKY